MASTPVISPTIVFVVGSIRCTLSPAALVWTMIGRRCAAAIDGVRAVNAKSATTRNARRGRDIADTEIDGMEILLSGILGPPFDSVNQVKGVAVGWRWVPSGRHFAIADLEGFVLAHRFELIAELLGMVQRWIKAGRPIPTGRGGRLAGALVDRAEDHRGTRRGAPSGGVGREGDADG